MLAAAITVAFIGPGSLYQSYNCVRCARKRPERVNAVVQEVGYAEPFPKLFHQCLVVGSSQTLLQQIFAVMDYKVG